MTLERSVLVSFTSKSAYGVALFVVWSELLTLVPWVGTGSPSSLSLLGLCLCSWPSVYPREEQPIPVSVDPQE